MSLPFLTAILLAGGLCQESCSSKAAAERCGTEAVTVCICRNECPNTAANCRQANAKCNVSTSCNASTRCEASAGCESTAACDATACDESQPSNAVLHFTAAWCGPCQQMSPVVHKLVREGYPIRKIDIDHHRELANQYDVTAIPAFVAVVNGREVGRLVGMTSEDQLARLARPMKVAVAPRTAMPRRPAMPHRPAMHAAMIPGARDVQPLIRATYDLPSSQAEALMAFLEQTVTVDVETRYDDEALTITTTPQAQQAIGEFVAVLMQQGPKSRSQAHAGRAQVHARAHATHHHGHTVSANKRLAKTVDACPKAAAKSKAAKSCCKSAAKENLKVKANASKCKSKCKSNDSDRCNSRKAVSAPAAKPGCKNECDARPEVSFRGHHIRLIAPGKQVAAPRCESQTSEAIASECQQSAAGRIQVMVHNLPHHRAVVLAANRMLIDRLHAKLDQLREHVEMLETAAEAERPE